MTPPARRPLSLPTGPTAPATPSPVRPAWPLLPDQPLPPIGDDEHQAVADPPQPGGRRRLWSGPRE